MLDSKALQFLRDLKENNTREWFQPRKEQFEMLLRQPMTDAVRTLNRVLETKAPHYVTDPEKSVYRVYRDIRFSPDKTPYKTHIGALLWHRQLGKDRGAVIYFHVSSTEFLIAFGLYMMPGDVLTSVRSHMATTHTRLEAIVKNKGVRQLFGRVQGEKLSRPPKGYSVDHPAIEYLKHKNLLLQTTMPPEAATDPEAINVLKKHVLVALPFVQYLNQPLLSASRRRDPLLMPD